jgi:hypothetical protein
MKPSLVNPKVIEASSLAPASTPITCSIQKTEGRNPKSETSPKSEGRNEFPAPPEKVQRDTHGNGLIRISGFGLLSDFGNSSFGIPVNLVTQPWSPLSHTGAIPLL